MREINGRPAKHVIARDISIYNLRAGDYVVRLGDDTADEHTGHRIEWEDSATKEIRRGYVTARELRLA